MSQKESNKEFISKAKDLFAEKGYEVKTSHLYDIFAKLSGYKDWHVASVKNALLANSIKEYVNENEPEITAVNYLAHINNFFLNEKDEQIPFDLFNLELPSWNYSISGQVGSGKTVLTNKVLSLTIKDYEAKYSRKVMVNIFDLSGDTNGYAKFVNLNNGHEVKLSRSKRPNIQLFDLNLEMAIPTPKKYKEIGQTLIAKNLTMETLVEVSNKVGEYFDELAGHQFYLDRVEKERIFRSIFDFPFSEEVQNIFSLKPGSCEPSVEQHNFLMSIFELILSSSPEDLDGFQAYDSDEISSFIKSIYRIVGDKESRFPRLSDLYSYLLEGQIDQSSPLGRKFLAKIKNWTTEGNYPYFDKETTLDVSNDIILVNLKGLDFEPKLRLVYFLMIDKILGEKMMMTRNRVKVMVKDELVSMHRYPSYRKNDLNNLKTSRRKGMAVINVSQLITDYLTYDKELGRQVIDKFQVNILGKVHSSETAAQVGGLLKLNPELSGRLKNLGITFSKNSNGEVEKKYLSFIIASKLKAEVYKNNLTPFELVYYSSNAEDDAIVDFYLKEKKSFSSLEKLLMFISENKHYGDQQLAEYLQKEGFINAVRQILRKPA